MTDIAEPQSSIRKTGRQHALLRRGGVMLCPHVTNVNAVYCFKKTPDVTSGVLDEVLSYPVLLQIVLCRVQSSLGAHAVLLCCPAADADAADMLATAGFDR